MMNDVTRAEIALVLGWDDLGETAGLRRNEAGFENIKDLAEKASPDAPLKLNAFLYAFLCSAKNFDLFLTENMAEVSSKIREIATKMEQLSEFEREARTRPPQALVETYLALRNVVARRTARDERRTLATLLFSGTSTADQVADDLGLSANLAQRVFRALEPVLRRPTADRVALHTDTDSLAAVLHLLRSTLGIDPLAILQCRIAARATERA